VGHASASEINSLGLRAALFLAGQRALRLCGATADILILDGNLDWISSPGLRSQEETLKACGSPIVIPRVVTKIKADSSCASVAAASILAKETRDFMMLELSHSTPQYDWANNKGYSSRSHIEALTAHGPDPSQHRTAWRLPGVE
jgi:ribonuclease HII